MTMNHHLLSVPIHQNHSARHIVPCDKSTLIKQRFKRIITSVHSLKSLQFDRTVVHDKKYLHLQPPSILAYSTLANEMLYAQKEWERYLAANTGNGCVHIFEALYKDCNLD